MPLWPFSRPEPEPTSAEELRSLLMNAVGTRHLKRLCRSHAQMARASVGVLRTVPEEMREELDAHPEMMQQYVQRLGTVAQCLAECGVPELWDALLGTPQTNPFTRWDDWLGKVQQRLAAFEHEQLVTEARELIADSQQLSGSAARQYEGYLRGRIGEALFHSGDVEEAAAAYEDALDYCRRQNDLDGVAAYLGNMKEVARYQGNAEAALLWAEELAAHQQARGLVSGASELQAEIKRLRDGEPPVRAVCRLPDGAYELDDLPDLQMGVSYKFEFVRNRPSLQKCVELTRRGAVLAADGQLADALERFDEASEVDPFDPDPVYQSGVVLMELGAYDQARERFEEVHRIAPGWFHCRFDSWLAGQLHDGAYPPDVWTVLRGLQDSGMESKQVLSIASQVVEKFADFAPFWLLLGEAQRDADDSEKAIESFRRGLTCDLEPDIESRLLLSLATTLDVEHTERRDLLDRIVNGDGNLFARSVATIMLRSA